MLAISYKKRAIQDFRPLSFWCVRN